MIWLWAVPVSSILLIVFSSIWGNKTLILLSISLLLWSTLACCHLQFLKYNLWSIYLLGIPLQLAILLSGKIKSKKS